MSKVIKIIFISILITKFRAVATATKQFNAQQAQERKQREAEEKAATLQDNLTEIKNQVFGDTLTENPAVARSAFGSHRGIRIFFLCNSLIIFYTIKI